MCRKMWCIDADATPYVISCGVSLLCPPADATVSPVSSRHRQSLLCPPADATRNVTSARQGLCPLGRTWSLRSCREDKTWYLSSRGGGRTWSLRPCREDKTWYLSSRGGGRTWSLRPRVIERTLGTRPRDAEPWARVNSARTRPCVLSARDREMWDLRLVSPLHISRSRRLSRSCIVRDTRPRQGPGRDDTTEMWGLGLARVSVLYRLGSDRASPRLHLESFAPVIASSVY